MAGTRDALATTFGSHRLDMTKSRGAAIALARAAGLSTAGFALAYGFSWWFPQYDFIGFVFALCTFVYCASTIHTLSGTRWMMYVMAVPAAFVAIGVVAVTDASASPHEAATGRSMIVVAGVICVAWLIIAALAGLRRRRGGKPDEELRGGDGCLGG